MLFYDILVFLTAAALTLALLVLISYMGLKLADDHGSDVRVVWYLFSLASTSTFLIALWASSVGAIDAHGSFHGDRGTAIRLLLHFMLDLESSLKLFGSLLAIVLIPQLFCYGLSGLFGCASRLILVGRSVSFFVWAVVKSFVVAAGIMLVLALYGFVRGWEDWGARGAVSMAFIPVVLLAISFYLLYVYRDISAGTNTVNTNRAEWLRVRAQCARVWMTRKIKLAVRDAG